MFQIDCHECDKVVDLIEVTNDDFQCPSCGTMYHSEDGVIDVELAKDMYKLYQGAKLAGLIEDKELKEEVYNE